MKHIVCFSKGHSSALVAIEVVRRFGKENVILLNHNINPSVEDADIKRFGNEVAAYLGLPITYANINGIEDERKLPDQFDVCLIKKAFKVPNTTNAFCTHRLKTEPFDEYLKTCHPNQDVVIYYGFDAKELTRKARRQAVLGSQGYDTDYPLIDWPERTIYSTTEIGILPPSTYSVTKHANCIGCLKGGIQHWYVVYCARPEIYDKGEATETLLGYTILKRQVRGKNRPFPLSEARLIFERMKCAGGA